MIGVNLINTKGLDSLIKRLGKLTDLRSLQVWEPLLNNLYGVIVEDNRKGVLSGLDKDGKPAPPLRYRNGFGRKTSARSGNRFGLQNEAAFSGRGVAPNSLRARTLGRAGFIRVSKTSLPNNNLTTAEYKKLTGPRLAPRREQSRVIANLTMLRHSFTNGMWIVTAAWRDVLTAKGRPLLPFHFDSTRPGMKYDLRGVRPWGMSKAGTIARKYARDLLAAFASRTP